MSFELHHPATVPKAIELASRLAPGARFIAGGTDLVIQINRKKAAPAHLIDIGRLPGLAGIVDTAYGYALGPLTTFRTIERHLPFQEALCALVEAARVVGGHQIRNIATIGGNIANASPAADFVPALQVLDATLDIAGPAGSRSVALGDFILGPGKADLGADELITGIRIGRLPANSATAFLKEGRRKAMEISVVCVAACLTLDAGGTRCLHARLAIGAAGPKTLRPQKAEAFLVDRPAEASSFRNAGQLAADASTPISDVRASAEYRRHLVAVLVERALTRCAERVAGGRR